MSRAGTSVLCLPSLPPLSNCAYLKASPDSQYLLNEICWKHEEHYFQHVLLLVVNGTCALVSVAGCLAIILSYIIFKQYRSPVARLVFCLSLNDLATYTLVFLSSVLLLTGLETRYIWFCVTVRVVIEFFFLSSFCWTLCIAVHVSMLVFAFGVDFVSSWGLIVFSPFCVIVPTLLVVGNLIVTWLDSDLYVYTFGCHLSEVGHFFFFYIPLFTFFFLIASLYVACVIRLTLHRKEIVSSMWRVHTKLTLYSLGFLLAWMPSLLNYSSKALLNCPIYILLLMQVITIPLLGAYNSVVYGFSAGLRRDSFAAVSTLWEKMLATMRGTTEQAPLLRNNYSVDGQGRMILPQAPQVERVPL